MQCILFNTFPGILRWKLIKFTPSLTINGLPIFNLRLADNIDLTGENTGLQVKNLTSKEDASARAVGMKISAEKRKILVCGGDH